MMFHPTLVRISLNGCNFHKFITVEPHVCLTTAHVPPLQVHTSVVPINTTTMKVLLTLGSHLLIGYDHNTFNFFRGCACVQLNMFFCLFKYFTFHFSPPKILFGLLLLLKFFIFCIVQKLMFLALKILYLIRVLLKNYDLLLGKIHIILRIFLQKIIQKFK